MYNQTKRVSNKSHDSIKMITNVSHPSFLFWGNWKVSGEGSRSLQQYQLDNSAISTMMTWCLPWINGNWQGEIRHVVWNLWWPSTTNI